MPQVNPEILRWAREIAGLTSADALAKLAIKDARGGAAVDRVIPRVRDRVLPRNCGGKPQIEVAATPPDTQTEQVALRQPAPISTKYRPDSRLLP